MPKTQYQSSQGASDLDPPDRGVFRETGFVFGSISGAVPLGSGPAPQKAPLSDGRFWRPLRGKLKHTFGGLAAGHRSPGPEPPTVFAIQGLATSGAVFKRCISRLRLNPGGGEDSRPESPVKTKHGLRPHHRRSLRRCLAKKNAATEHTSPNPPARQRLGAHRRVSRCFAILLKETKDKPRTTSGHLSCALVLNR